MVVVKNICSPKLCPYLISAVVMAFRSKWNGSQDHQADFLRRIFDSDDWGLSPLSFHHIGLVWGPHSVDRFANHVNGREYETPSFWNPGSEGIDTFVVNWHGENKYARPPICLILRVFPSYA